MKPSTKKFLFLTPQILYVAIPTLYIYLSCIIGMFEDHNYYATESLASEILRKSGSAIGISFLFFTVLYAVTVGFYVKSSGTAAPCLLSGMIISAVSLPIQLIFVFSLSFGFFAGTLIGSLMITGGLMPIYLLTPIVTAILLVINFILCIPSFLHALFGILRARRENLLTKLQTVLLIIFIIDPMLRFIPVMIAMILVRKKEKLAVIPKTPMLSAN